MGQPYIALYVPVFVKPTTRQANSGRTPIIYNVAGGGFLTGKIKIYFGKNDMLIKSDILYWSYGMQIR
jgi:hypothetical protein